MNKTLSIACALVALATAGSALADGSAKATLESPIAARAKILAAHAVWDCEGTTCVAGAAPDGASGPSACKELAKQVGRITAYQEFRPLDESGLAKCNAGVAAKATASR
jgi:hypothetical protein